MHVAPFATALPQLGRRLAGCHWTPARVLSLLVCAAAADDGIVSQQNPFQSRQRTEWQGMMRVRLTSLVVCDGSASIMAYSAGLTRRRSLLASKQGRRPASALWM